MAKRTSDFIRWWSERGENMRVLSVNALKREIIIGCAFDKMRLEIRRPNPIGDWIVKWFVPQTDRPDDEHNFICGERTFTHNEIRCAFGLEHAIKRGDAKELDQLSLDRQWIEKYRIDVGVIGKFMRQGNQLNIPSNNTNFEPRRAVSIRITKEMQRLFLDTSIPSDANILAENWPRG